jgi:hypothetical protein
MAKIESEFVQKQQDDLQKAHGEKLQKHLLREGLLAKVKETRSLTDTLQTTRAHLGKVHTEEDKPDDMEAAKVGSPDLSGLKKIPKDHGDQTVDVAQTSEAEEEAAAAEAAEAEEAEAAEAESKPKGRKRRS